VCVCVCQTAQEKRGEEHVNDGTTRNGSPIHTKKTTTTDVGWVSLLVSNRLLFFSISLCFPACLKRNENKEESAKGGDESDITHDLQQPHTHHTRLTPSAVLPLAGPHGPVIFLSTLTHRGRGPEMQAGRRGRQRERSWTRLIIRGDTFLRTHHKTHAPKERRNDGVEPVKFDQALHPLSSFVRPSRCAW
jgi:hypothetical protein